ncbi:MAG: DUF4340 domain-containing protein [Desulfomicrobium escambiense]|nr:DUF4340 domain-containing protein [Desulfomicrobium escambiense]
MLADLDRKVEEIREKKVAEFYAWDAKSVLIKRDGLEISAVKEKTGDEEKWLLDPATKEEADRTKVEDFVRKIEGLEAAAFVDAPGPSSGYGLDPGTEVRIKTQDLPGPGKGGRPLYRQRGRGQEAGRGQEPPASSISSSSTPPSCSRPAQGQNGLESRAAEGRRKQGR